MKRTDWENQLHQFIKEHRTAAFRWGANDCCLFANKCVKAMTDLDIVKESGYSWKTKKEVIAHTKEAGAKDFGEMMAHQIDKHFERIPKEFARKGDLALIQTTEGDGMGIFYGGRIAALSKKGLVFVNRNMAKVVWRVV